MKNTIIVLLCVFSVCNFINAQEKFITKTGELSFEASVPSFEEVQAKNENVSAILKSTGEFASLALMKGFRFKVALMEEHFNENYAETSKFPKTTFRGTIENFDLSQLSENDKTFIVKGIITMHGVEKPVEVPAAIKKIEEIIYLSANFILKPGDFDIEIPSIVSSKIAEEVNVTANFILKSKS